jgi:hypothetical protein
LRGAGVALRFGRLCGALGFVSYHWVSGVLGFPAPDHPCYLFVHEVAPNSGGGVRRCRLVWCWAT